MIPNVAIVCRPAGPMPSSHRNASASVVDPSNARRKAALAIEARRLARRRSVAEAVARRSQDNDRNLSGEAPTLIFRRARRRATRLSLVFHRAIESLWEAGGFDEALVIFREHQHDLARRTARTV